jgi:hypothetical protein
LNNNLEDDEEDDEEDEVALDCLLNSFNLFMFALMSAGELTVRANIPPFVPDAASDAADALAATDFLFARSNNLLDVLAAVVPAAVFVNDDEVDDLMVSNDAEAEEDRAGLLVANAASNAAEASFTLAFTSCLTLLILKSSNKSLDVFCAISTDISNLSGKEGLPS